MNDGWIKLHRQLKEWQHYQEPFVLLVWLDLLLSANMKAGWVRGNRINRGQLITSVARIMESTGIGSDNTVRDALRKLEESGEIKREQIGIGTKITINHFNKFQTSAQNAQPSAQPTAEVGAYPSAEVGAQPTAQPGADKQEYIECKKEEEKNINPLPHARAREIGIEAFGSFANVFLFPAEHRTLSETYGQELTAKAVDDLSCKIAEGDEQALNSRNHYATLDRWLRYKRETAKVPLNSSQPQPKETNEEFVIRIAWQALTDQEKKDYMDTHGGKTLIETKGAI